MGSVVGEEAGYFGSKDILDPKRCTCLDRSQLHIRHRELLGRHAAILPAYTSVLTAAWEAKDPATTPSGRGSIHLLSLCVSKNVTWESSGWLDSLERCYLSRSKHERQLI